MKARNITDAAFPAEVLQSGKPTLVDLWAPWCGPCRFSGPIVEEIAGENEGRFDITKLNIDDHPKIASGLGVRSIPTLLSDLTMLVLTGGQERTEEEYARLFAGADLRLTSVLPVAYPYGVFEGAASA